MDEHLPVDEIERYWSRTSTPEEVLRVGDHLAICERCRNAAAAQRNVARKIESLDFPEAPRARSWMWGLVAAAALVVTAGLAAWFRADRSTPPRVMIQDANGPIYIDAAGHVHGVPPEDRDEVARLLTTGRLRRPAVLQQLAAPADEMRGSTVLGSRKQTLRLESPVGVVVPDDRPVFRWRGKSGSQFEVTVVDQELNVIVRSPRLEVMEWTPAVALPHGRTLMWQVAAQGSESEVAPRAPAELPQFRVLDDVSRARIARARRSGSRLLLAAALADAGLQRDAEAALRELAARNPRSPIPAKLLESIRAH
jgi:hypothetical protein